MSKKQKRPASSIANPWLSRPGRILLWMTGVAILLYLPQLGGAFIFDDVHYVQHNPFLTSWDTFIHWNQFLRSRPLYWLSFFIQKQLWGNDPTGYKIVSVLAHGMSAFLLYLAMVRLVRLKKMGTPWLPLITGTLFLVSPVATEAVCYISGQNNGLGGLFFIASVWKLLQALDPTEPARRNKRLGQSIVLMMVAFLFKEVYIVGFFILPAIYLWAGTPDRRTLVIAAISVVVLVLLAGVATYTLNVQPFPRIRRGLTGKSDTMFTRKAIATNMIGLATGLRLSVVPVDLNIDHDLPVVERITDPRSLIAIGALLLVGVLLFLFRKRWPLGLPAYLLWLLLMAPTNSFILRHGEWMIDPLSERNLYAPAMAISLLLAHILMTAIRSRRFQLAAVSLLIAVFGIRTTVRAFDFRNNAALWSASVRWSPNRARPHYNLAVALHQQGQPDKALPHARRAVELSPEPHCFGLLANLYLATQQPDMAEATLKRGLLTVRTHRDVLMNQLGQFYYERQQFGKAAAQFREAIAANPKLVLPRITLTYILLTRGKTKQAGAQLKQLEKLMKQQERVFRQEEIITARHRALLAFARGWYLLDSGRVDAGIRHLKQATTLDPGFVEPYLKLGEYYYRHRQYTESWDWFLKASRLKEFGRYTRQAGPYLRNLPKLLENPELDPGL